MFKFDKLVAKARYSPFYLWLFNKATAWMIPFNKPHGFRITKLGEQSIETYLPYKNLNLNHIKGIHACALATLSEFTTGALLLTGLPANKYRLILKTLHIDYHFQAKMAVKAKFGISEEWINEKIISPLSQSDSVVVPCEVEIFDLEDNHISTASVEWQLKEWAKVRTKV